MRRPVTPGMSYAWALGLVLLSITCVALGTFLAMVWHQGFLVVLVGIPAFCTGRKILLTPVRI